MNYNGTPPETFGPDGESPPQTTVDYDIWFRSPHLLIHKMIANPEYKGQFYYAPYQEYSMDGQHCLKMSCPEIGLGKRRQVKFSLF